MLEYWDSDDPAGSRERFTLAAEQATDPARRQALLTQVARAHGLDGAFDSGHQVLDELGELNGLDTEPRVRLALERGRLLRSAGDPAGCAPYFREAYDAALTTGMAGLAADAAHMLALVLPDEEETWTERGLRAAAGSSDPLALSMTGGLLNNRGWALADAGSWADAYALFDRAVEARSRVEGPSAASALHVARWARARATRALGRHDEALAELRELAATELGAADSYVTEEIAANESRRRD
ncbi:hypothetical protein [Nocardioides speluncae]|uniref:hypothetical protein n=1 Tax=Nocardioides speluncae TaxID=2670337 RepID=UPI000D68D754|nr:hypothetical protein [Nocardioides speluncae]